MHGSKERERERESECVPLNVCVRDCDHITCVNMRGDSVSICACARARVCVCVCVCVLKQTIVYASLLKKGGVGKTLDSVSRGKQVRISISRVTVVRGYWTQCLVLGTKGNPEVPAAATVHNFLDPTATENDSER